VESWQEVKGCFTVGGPAWLHNFAKVWTKVDSQVGPKLGYCETPYYNQQRLPTPTYQPGDKVYLDASDISTTRPSWKLSHRRLGPYVIDKQVSWNTYRLKLPDHMRRLHPVFNMVELTPAPHDLIEGRHPMIRSTVPWKGKHTKSDQELTINVRGCETGPVSEVTA